MAVKVTTGGSGPGVGAQVGVRRARARPLSPVTVIHGVRHPGSGAGPEHEEHIVTHYHLMRGHSPGQSRGRGGGRCSRGLSRGVIRQGGGAAASTGPALVAEIV